LVIKLSLEISQPAEMMRVCFCLGILEFYLIMFNKNGGENIWPSQGGNKMRLVAGLQFDSPTLMMQKFPLEQWNHV
jgi:hypothetical protein